MVLNWKKGWNSSVGGHNQSLPLLIEIFYFSPTFSLVSSHFPPSSAACVWHVSLRVETWSRAQTSFRAFREREPCGFVLLITPASAATCITHSHTHPTMGSVMCVWGGHLSGHFLAEPCHRTSVIPCQRQATLLVSSRSCWNIGQVPSSR